MKYRIEWLPDKFVVGELQETRGNNEEYPTFLLDDGRLVSAPIERAKEIPE